MFNKKQNIIIIIIAFSTLLSCIVPKKMTFQVTEKERISRPGGTAGKPAAGKKKKGDGGFFAGSFIVKGAASTVTALGKNKVPLNKTENCELSDIPEQRLEIFVDSGNNSRDCIELHYINEDYVQCGITTKAWDVLNISEYNALMLCVKGKDGNEELNLVKLRDDLDQNLMLQLDVGLYVPSSSITTEWQKVIIPFSDIPKLETISLKGFKFMIFKFGPKGEHTIYLDNIMFIKQEEKPAPPAPEETPPEEISPEPSETPEGALEDIPKELLDENTPEESSEEISPESSE